MYIYNMHIFYLLCIYYLFIMFVCFKIGTYLFIFVFIHLKIYAFSYLLNYYVFENCMYLIYYSS